MSTPLQLVAQTAASFEIRYAPLSNAGHTLCFPCDEEGHVDLDALSSRSLCDYLFARAMVGREFDLPHVGSVCDLCLADRFTA
ncbi:hypothetical protein [Aquabacterium sp.]|uniref:hypothetical protein n=1 Tax=Aquabacterium sp. TaxID=1872578 RepID=UPI002BD86EE6|nr:hypothetical protein [Aquabacterium sp.]HSW05479.1 hypothetical protein [Aquabacterium sp.]